MAIKPSTSVIICALLLCMLASDSCLSQEAIGTVTRADDKSHIKRKDTDIPTDQLKGESIEIGDTLTSHDNQTGAQLQISLTPDGRRKTSIVMEHATLGLSEKDGQLMCYVKGRVLYSRGRKVKFNRREKSAEDKCTVLFSGRTAYRAHGTQFMLDARGMETSLYVMDGAVEAFRDDVDPPEKQMVFSGEWLLIREDEPIPSPKRFRRRDVSAGSSQCIYSDCTINDRVPIVEPPTPGQLAPPPPNPPGFQR